VLVSIPVSLAELRVTADGFDRDPYLLTVDPDGRPRSVAVSVEWQAEVLVVVPGKRTRRNGMERPLVSLVWPPTASGGYTLIVDGQVERNETDGEGTDLLVVRPTSGVLHRPARITNEQGSGCQADCVPIPGRDTRAPATETTRSP
jgi:hypothetical protein